MGRSNLKKREDEARKRGFALWPDRVCGYCGVKEPDASEASYRLECPGCYRDGCHECMPLGRGCLCPECEDADD